MPGISLILFDLNGVLYRYDRDARIVFLASLLGKPAAGIKSAIWESGFEDEGDAGAVDADTYLRGFGQRIGYELAEPDWLDALLAAISPMTEALALLGRLRPGVRCAVLTNNNLLVRRNFATLFPELLAVAGERCFVSAEFGALKPDTEVFRRCLGRLGVTPAEALFIDDSAANVRGAREAGLFGFHYENSRNLAAELFERGLLLS